MLRSVHFRRARLGTLFLAASLLLIAPRAQAQGQDQTGGEGRGWEWEEDARAGEDKNAKAEAVDDDPFDRPGFYAGISGVYAYNFFDQAIEDFLEDELGQQGSVDIDDSGGLNARIGYRAVSWFAAEIQYEWVETYDVNVSGDVGPGGGTLSGKLYDIGGHTLTLNTKWIIPFWRIQPYLLVGAGGSFYDVGRGPLAAPLEAADDDIEIEGGNQSAFAGRAGLGFDIYLTEHIVISTEATAMVTTEDFETPSEGAIDELYYLSIGAGLQYRF